MSQDSRHLITVHAQTDVGMVRAGNEDTFLVLNLDTSDTWTPATFDGEPPDHLASFPQGSDGTILAVSDGMGGALAGEVASRMAVEGVRDHMLHFKGSVPFSSFPFHERLRLAVEQANSQINNESLGNADYAGMGATFTAAGIHDGVLVLAQIGDSRCYLIRNNKISLLTHDQSLVWQLVEAGHITEEEAETHQYKNVILQALGAQPRVNVVVDRVPVHNGDHVLLCSDGLSGRVRAEEMLDIVTKASDLKQACDRLIQLANDRGGEDNITVVLARFDGDGLPPPGDLESERIERDPNLPYEVDIDVYLDAEPTLNPDGTNPITVEHVRIAGARTAGDAKGATKVLTENADVELGQTPAGHEITHEMAARIARLNEEAEFPVTTSVGMPALTLEEIAGHAAAMAKEDEKAAKPAAASGAQPKSSQASSGNRTGQIIAVVAVVALVVALIWFLFGQQSASTIQQQQTITQANDLNRRVKDAQGRLKTLVPKIDGLPQGAQHEEAARLRTSVSENINRIQPLVEPMRATPDSLASATTLCTQIETDLLTIERLVEQTATVPPAVEASTTTGSAPR